MDRTSTKVVLVSLNVPTYTPSQIAANYRRCRSYMLHDFAWYGGRGSNVESPEVDAFVTPEPITRGAGQAGSARSMLRCAP